MSNIVIGIEGLVGAGKTTICRNLVNIIPNAILLQGGNLYRTIVATLMDKKDINSLIENAENIDIKQMMDSLNIEIKFENRETVFYVDGKKVDEDLIQSKEISLAVSSIGGKANEARLYQFAKELIDKLKEEYNIIVSGRDLMKIYPDLDYHIFITADLDTRVQRKAMQYKDKNLDEIKANIMERDNLQRQAGYYDLTDSTVVVDITDCKTPEESTKKVLEVIDF